MPGLRLALVGDGGGADLEVALGRGKLFRHSGLLCAHEGQRVACGQHVKVGLGDANQQILLGAFELRLGKVRAALALLKGDAVGRAVQGLRRLHTQRLRRAIDIHVGQTSA